ncbi:hypothetical protein PVAP13_7NG088825 [Panicum virgatum]|uniref:Uncharacterized protein n=1 Tax=Panicum virgatum TaxID=38727 RepID=A0A8T0Q0H7_PANVG|nr:hypothetical protein PVAP13_7NG088825 [Panicum virgatum]
MASNSAVAAEVSTAVTKLNEHLAKALNGADATAGAANNTTVITLAGENSGATMEAEDLVVVGNEDVVISAYTNSNYQAVNNSVLVSGSCAVNDPGVHVVVVEHVDEIRDYDDDDLDDQEF